MIEKIEESHLLLSWGITVALAWTLTAVMGTSNMFGYLVMPMWTVLMLIPIGMTVLLKYRGDSNRLFDMWAVLVTVLMIENFLTPDIFRFYSYFHLWFIAAVPGFYYTSKKIPPPSEKTYRYGAIASALALPLVFYRPLLAPLLAVPTQGIPMLYDWYTVHR